MARNFDDDSLRELAQWHIEDVIAPSVERSDRPTAIFLAGQPGAGKTTITPEITDRLAEQGGHVLISADEARTLLPNFAALQARDPASASRETQEDAGRLAQLITDEAVKRGFNVVIDGTLRDPDRAENEVASLRSAGYRTELHALAVSDQLSFARSAERYSAAIERGDVEAARWVDRAYHDNAFNGVGQSVRRLEFKGLVDQVTVYNRLGDTIHEGPARAGDTPGTNAFEAARQQLTGFERRQIAETYDRVQDRLGEDALNPTRFPGLASAIYRAHYSLEADPAARDAYREDNLDRRADSEQKAEVYRRELSQAWDRQDRNAMKSMPELRVAEAHKIMAERQFEGMPEAQRKAALDTAMKQIEKGLRSGRQKLPDGVSVVRPTERKVDRDLTEQASLHQGIATVKARFRDRFNAAGVEPKFYDAAKVAPDKGQFLGTIVYATPHHAFQRIADNKFVVHNAKSLDVKAERDKAYQINYEKGKGTVLPFQRDRSRGPAQER